MLNDDGLRELHINELGPVQRREAADYPRC